MHIQDEDYQSLETFGLRWRWDTKHSPQMTPSELSRIRPLTSEKAQELVQESRQFRVAHDPMLLPNATLFSLIMRLDTSNETPEIVCQWLELQIPPTTDLVIVSWSPEYAALTERGIFVKFWNDFCYPASDDVTIWPVSKNWVVLYGHEEILYVATTSK